MKLLHSAAVLLVITAPLSSAWASSAKKRGAQVYADYGCQHCHSIHHDGGGVKGPDLSGVGLRLTDEQIRTQLVKGGRQMPPFGNILQKTEMDDLVAYLDSCRDKNSEQTSPIK